MDRNRRLSIDLLYLTLNLKWLEVVTSYEGPSDNYGPCGTGRPHHFCIADFEALGSRKQCMRLTYVVDSIAARHGRTRRDSPWRLAGPTGAGASTCLDRN